MNALVLSGGGMFGAYQAGAWQAIAAKFQPDLIVGVSVGALNGYMIASRAAPEILIEHWLKLEAFQKVRPRPRWNPLQGTIDVRHLEALLESVAAQHTPSIPLTVLATDLFKLRLKQFSAPGLTWRHLAASCALLGLLPQYRIDGRRYSDGGLLCGLPIRPAAQMGARRIVAINCLPGIPLPIRAGLRLLRYITQGGRPRSGHTNGQLEAKIDVTLVAPQAPLGPLKEAACWDRARAERWIEAGRRDAEAALLDC